MRFFCCDRPLANLDPKGNQPDNGLEFISYGHYGSTVFDPMDGTFLAINICDSCLKSAARGRGLILHGRPAYAAPRRAEYSNWKK